MKKLLCFMLTAAIFSSVSAQDKSDQPFMVKTFPASSVKSLEAETAGGHISVTGGTGSEAKVEVYIQSSNGNKNLSKDEIQKKLNEDYELSVTVTGSTLKAIAKRKNNKDNWNNGLSVSFTCYTPSAISTDLETSGGHISLSNLTGTEKFSTSGGHLDLEKLKGKINGSTSGGHITIKNSSENITLSTSGGHITAESCSGDLDLTTSGGSLNLSDLSGKIHATTSGGNVHGENIKGDLNAGTSGGNVNLENLSGNVEAHTSGGNITVQVKEPAQYIKLNNSGGKVELQIPANKGYTLDLSGKIKVGTLKNFSGDTGEDYMKGTLNGGGTKVNINSGDGRVTLVLQ
jgi:hypothetical protein